MQIDFEHIYQTTYPVVFRRASRFFSGSELEDVVQEIFLRIFQKLPSFNQGSSLTTWVYSVTTHYCLNLIRNQKRQHELLTQWTSAIPVEEHQTPDSKILLEQIWARIDEHVVLETAFYYFVDEMTQAEIAQTQNITERTVRNRIQKMRELGSSLKEKL